MLNKRKSTKEGKENLKLKLFFYLLIGFILSFLTSWAFLLGLLWILFRTKNNKKFKLIAFLVGFILFFPLIPYRLENRFEVNQGNSKPSSDSPQLMTIYNKLTKDYSNDSVSVHQSGVYTEKTCIVLDISIKSTTKLLSDSEIAEIAKNACYILGDKSREYCVNVDSVKLKKSSLNRFIPQPVENWSTESQLCHSRESWESSWLDNYSP